MDEKNSREQEQKEDMEATPQTCCSRSETPSSSERTLASHHEKEKEKEREEVIVPRDEIYEDMKL
jgi:hypothetical protein